MNAQRERRVCRAEGDTVFLRPTPETIGKLNAFVSKARLSRSAICERAIEHFLALPRTNQIEVLFPDFTKE